MSDIIKPCVVCGKSCEGLKRVKDAKGRYAHVACAEMVARKKAGRQLPPAPAEPSATPPPTPQTPATPAATSPVGNDWLGDAVDHQPIPCPACGRHIDQHAALCTHCGTNIQTGKSMRTRVLDAPKERGSAGGGGGGGGLGDVFNNPLIVFVVGLVLWGVFGAVAFAGGESMATPALAVAGLWAFAAWVMMVSAAFSDGDSTWGWVGLGTIIPCLGGICGIAFTFYYCIFGSERTGWKANYWMAQGATIIVYIGVMGTIFSEALDDIGPNYGAYPTTTTSGDTYARLNKYDLEDGMLVHLASSIITANANEHASDLTSAEVDLLNNPETRFADFPKDVQDEARARYNAMTPYEKDRLHDIAFIYEEGFQPKSYHGRLLYINYEGLAYDAIEADERGGMLLVALMNESLAEKDTGRRRSSLTEEEQYMLNGGVAPTDYHLGLVEAAVARWHAMDEAERQQVRSNVFSGYETDTSSLPEDVDVWIERTAEAQGTTDATPDDDQP